MLSRAVGAYLLRSFTESFRPLGETGLDAMTGGR